MVQYVINDTDYNILVMIKNYIRVALRSVRNNRIFSFINITGLGFGITCSLLILLWVQDERGYDNDQVNGKRMFMIYQRQFIDQKVDAGYYTPGLLSVELKKNIPEIEKAAGYMHCNNATFEGGDKVLKLNGAWTGADFFDIFSYPVLLGNRNTALNSISSMAISNGMAIKFFGVPPLLWGKRSATETKLISR